MTTTTPLKLMELMQCAKQRCGHVLWKGEEHLASDPSRPAITRHLCPKCHGDGFYTLSAQGRTRTTKDNRENKPREINPADIEPSPRMGLKMKRRLLAAKRRALETFTPIKEAQP